MSNPGAASTQTTNYLFNGNASDGVLLGIATGKVGFYGETPVVQRANGVRRRSSAIDQSRRSVSARRLRDDRSSSPDDVVA